MPFRDGSFGLGAGFEDGHDCIVPGHHFCFCPNILIHNLPYAPAAPRAIRCSPHMQFEAIALKYCVGLGRRVPVFWSHGRPAPVQRIFMQVAFVHHGQASKLMRFLIATREISNKSLSKLARAEAKKWLVSARKEECSDCETAAGGLVGVETRLKLLFFSACRQTAPDSDCFYVT